MGTSKGSISPNRFAFLPCSPNRDQRQWQPRGLAKIEDFPGQNRQQSDFFSPIFPVLDVLNNIYGVGWMLSGVNYIP